MFPPVNGSYSLIGTSIGKNTGYNDAVFSPDFEIPENPPQQLSYSMKRVYYINSTMDIENKVKGINSSYNIVIVLLYPPTGNWIKILGNTTPKLTTTFIIIDSILKILLIIDLCFVKS